MIHMTNRQNFCRKVLKVESFDFNQCSCFNISINIYEDSTYSIKHNSNLALFLQVTKLIIWDEALITHKHAFEVVDRILKSLMKVVDLSLEEKPFGSKI